MVFREAALSEPLDERSIELRQMILEAVSAGGRGHIGPSLSLLEIVSTLYDSILNHSPKHPDDTQRDIFILSKGHACLALYAVLAQHGYFPKEELLSFCGYESRLGGHPEWHELPGIEFSTGSLGHGLAVATGIAKAFKLKRNSRKVYVLMGDGELGEGSVWESAMHASKHQLDNLTAIIDYNNMQAYGSLDSVLPLNDLASKWESFGFSVFEVNGHSRSSLIEALKSNSLRRPRAIIAHTIKGKGIPLAENSAEWHHKSKISREDISQLLMGTK